MDFIQQIQKLTIESPAFCCYLGALILHIFSLQDRNFHGTEDFLKGVLPEKSSVFYKRVDFVILPIIGAILARVLISPVGVTASMCAGLTWTGTMAAALKGGNHRSPQLNKDLAKGQDIL